MTTVGFVGLGDMGSTGKFEAALNQSRTCRPGRPPTRDERHTQTTLAGAHRGRLIGA
jgi:hypothetical protein